MTNWGAGKAIRQLLFWSLLIVLPTAKAPAEVRFFWGFWLDKKTLLAPRCILIKMREIEALYATSFICHKRWFFVRRFELSGFTHEPLPCFKCLHWVVFKTHGHDIIVFCMWQRVGNRKDIYPVWKEMFFFSNNFEIEILRHFNFQSDGALNSLRSEIIV